MEEKGRVIKIDKAIALVHMEPRAACTACGLCSWGPKREEMFLEADNLLGAQVGQIVKVRIESRHVLLAAFIIYIVPLIGMVIGYYFGLLLAGRLSSGDTSENMGIAFALLFLVFSFFFARYADRQLKRAGKLKATISEVIFEE